MSFLSSGGGGFQGGADADVQGVPDDSIQCMEWHSEANFLAAGAWDSTVCSHTRTNMLMLPSGSILGGCTKRAKSAQGTDQAGWTCPGHLVGES